MLNLASASMKVLKKSQDVRAQYMFLYIIYANYNYKPLVDFWKPVILWNKLKEVDLKRDLKLAQVKKKGENKVLVDIYF